MLVQTDSSNGKTPNDDEGIASLAKLAKVGTLAEINWTDERDENNAVLALAAFLSGAGDNQFFGVIGWHWNCEEIPVDTLAPLCVLLKRIISSPSFDIDVGVTTALCRTLSLLELE
jgi:hypothetical protein